MAQFYTYSYFWIRLFVVAMSVQPALPAINSLNKFEVGQDGMGFWTNNLRAFLLNRTVPTERIGVNANLFALYCVDPTGATRAICSNEALGCRHHAEIARWNPGAEPWGLRARIPEPGQHASKVVEIGDLDGTPSWIAYPTEGGWQLDEFDGDSRRYPSLASVLHAIADV
ncbi:hypothetical protein WDZ11_22990 (plasmid) [Roseomonas mucosa]|uniref:hypothetical protein n=1 Tax=Roseomonas mucosa TaxID=207340 RepID=UPI0030D1C116